MMGMASSRCQYGLLRIADGAAENPMDGARFEEEMGLLREPDDSPGPNSTEVVRPALPDELSATGVLAIGRRVAATSVPAIARALLSGGVRVLELTLNEPEDEALAAIETAAALAQHEPGSMPLLGAGTVRSIRAAGRALDAGAEFLVTPHCDPDLIAWVAARGIPIVPGAFTTTEIMTAWSAGASAVKLFPASIVGPSIVRELRGPIPDIPLVPTGGISLETAAAFIAEGAVAVGIGGWLLGDWMPAGIAERARLVTAAIADARSAERDPRNAVGGRTDCS
jgi:2-dehydro-3-deoxyphosphogluconate aldolase/(4S)-4-hydroxy-2-oxoglutarate aldolase